MEWISSYEPAIETLLSGRHELCLLDYNLGARTGLDLLREAMARGCRTPIIMLTGNDDWEVDVKAMEAGAADYLVKGQFGRPALERSIRYAIGFAVERQQTLEALRRSEERYALAVRGANDGLWDWDLTTNRIYYAPRWKSMLGYDDGQIGDSPEEWFGRVHPLDVERVKAEVDGTPRGAVRPTSRPSTACSTTTGLTAGFSPAAWPCGTTRARPSGWRALSPTSPSERRPRTACSTTRSTTRLTGLPNRALLLDRLGQAVARTKRRPDSRFGVLFLDIDGFKLVNDSLGHQMGDQLLIAISRRLESCLRDGDTVARVGGDEFIILIDDVAETHDVILSLADRVLESLQTPFSLDGHELVVTASIGVALSGDRTSTRAEEVVRNADIAMYRAKSRGKAGFVVFDEAMHAERREPPAARRPTCARRRRAGNFSSITSRSCRSEPAEIRSFEALLRWYHPDRGLVCPDDFIPLAEETKLILPIGMWVIRTAADQLRKWQDQFCDDPSRCRSA